MRRLGFCIDLLGGSEDEEGKGVCGCMINGYDNRDGGGDDDDGDIKPSFTRVLASKFEGGTDVLF